MGPVTKLLSTGIGMTKEFQAQRQRSKSPSPAVEAVEADARPVSDEEEDELDTDQAQWELDDAQEMAPPPYDSSAEDKNDADKILSRFLAAHPPPSSSQGRVALPLPVIIPQKRPGSKLHGFIHAYAPVLEDCGVDQKTWFEFLDGFGKAIKYSPAFHVTNIAVGMAALGVTVVAGPMLITHAVALTVHTSIEASRRGYIRYQSNKFLDSINDQYFKPRGLYCMVFTYNPKSSKAVESVDVQESIEKGIAKRVDGDGSKFGGTAGETHHDWELPESAPLVFPELDKQIDQSGGKMKQAGHFMQEYGNRKARAKFEAENPDSRLNVLPQEEFASRYSDPNHPANSGNPIDFLTGGKTNRGTLRSRLQERRGMMQQRRGKSPRKEGGSSGRGGVLGAAKRKMHEDVVYLMVVNLPSEEEMERIKADVGSKQMGDDAV